MAAPYKVAFVCTGNACRSQMAEGFARQLASPRLRVFSAGTSPSAVNPLAVEVMAECGVDISRQASKSLDDLADHQPFDHVVTVCDHARQSCPHLTGTTQTVHWPLDDPAAAVGDREEVLAVFRRVRDEIRERVSDFLRATTGP